MNARLDIPTETLADEVARYLAAIDVFRALDCEPRWRPEIVPSDTPASLARGERSIGSQSSEPRRP